MTGVALAALVDDDPETSGLIEERFTPAQAQALLKDDWADLTEVAEDALVQVQAVAARNVRSKLVVTAMAGSSIAGQLAILDACSMDPEVCMVSWHRHTDDEGKVHVGGHLPPDNPEDHRFTAVRI